MVRHRGESRFDALDLQRAAQFARRPAPAPALERAGRLVPQQRRVAPGRAFAQRRRPTFGARDVDDVAQRFLVAHARMIELRVRMTLAQQTAVALGCAWLACALTGTRGAADVGNEHVFGDDLIAPDGAQSQAEIEILQVTMAEAGVQAAELRPYAALDGHAEEVRAVARGEESGRGAHC